MKLMFVIFSTFLVSLNCFAVPAEGHRMMVAAPSYRAIEVGQSVAKKGGNVVDVAVAVELALAVTSPYFASIGGGGFAMIRMNQQDPVALDFRETAPILTHPQFYRDKGEKASTIGSLAVGIPGIPAGIWEIHKKYGKLIASSRLHLSATLVLVGLGCHLWHVDNRLTHPTITIWNQQKNPTKFWP